MNTLPAQTTIAEKVANRIRDQFMELVPAEDFENMVKAQIQWFTTRPSKKYANDKEPESPLESLLREELRKHYSDAVHKAVNEWSGSWDQYGKATASEATKRLVTENADAILASMMAGLIQGALSDFNQHISRRLSGGEY